MAYQVDASRLTRTIVRINSTVKNIEADKFSDSLNELTALNTKAEQPDFKSSLDTFLSTNLAFQEAFRYEGAFGKWCHSESYDIDRSKKILDGLILAVGKRIEHLTTQKNTINDKVQHLFGAQNYDDKNDQFFPSIRTTDRSPSNILEQMNTYHCKTLVKLTVAEHQQKATQLTSGVLHDPANSAQNRKTNHDNWVDKFNSHTKPRAERIELMTQYVTTLTEIDAELENLTALQLQAVQARADLELSWGGLFNTYLAR